MRNRRLPAVRRVGEAGFTLIELMIVVAIMGILGDTMARVLKYELRGVMDAQADMARVEQARQAASAVVRDLKQAKSVDPVPARLGGAAMLKITELDGRRIDYGLARGVLLRREIVRGKKPELRALARDVKEVRVAHISGKGGKVVWVGWQVVFARNPGRIHAASAALPR